MYTSCSKTHCNGCMNVAWALFWGGSRSETRVFFRIKSLRPAMKGTSCARRVRSVRFCVWLVHWWCFAMLVSPCVRSCRVFWNLWLQIALPWLPRCILVVAKRIVMAAWMLHGACAGKEAGARNLVFFPCEVALAGDERYLVCAAGAVRSFLCAVGSLMVFCNACFVACA